MGDMVTQEHFGTLPDGTAVTSYALSAPGGPELRVLDLGATVQSLWLRDPGAGLPAGLGANIALGSRDVAGYLAEPAACYGATVGRYANRIAGARFSIDGTEYTVDANEGPNCLHGGRDGFHRRLWSVTQIGDDAVTLQLVSPAGDQGFPGELTATATYTALADGVAIELAASTTAATVVSLTNHSYFNLRGESAGTVDDHLLTVDADEFLPIDGTFIPLGMAAAVDDSPFDLRAGALIGERVRAAHQQIGLVHGLDHAFILRGAGLRRAARLEHPSTGRWLEVHTDQPSLQVYTGNFLDGADVGTGGRRYRQGDGIALETQRHPDAPNQHWLPSPVLRPGQLYHARTEWHVGTEVSRL